MHLVNLVDKNLKVLDLKVIPLETTHLSIVDNLLTFLPEKIGKLKRLKIIEASFNQLEALPDSICELGSLTELHLSDNKLTHLPENIGKLKNLKLLDLQNNQLEKLPESIKELAEKTVLCLSGNKLPLPLNYQDGQNTAIAIDYILKHQTPPTPSIQIETNDIYIFRNISNQKEFQEEYKTNINKALEDYSLNIHEVHSIEDLTNETTIVFIIAPYDTHENQKLIFDIISKCQEKKIKFSILIPEKKSVHAGLVNMTYGSLIDKVHRKLHKIYVNNVFYFKSILDLTNTVIDALKYLSPKKIKLKKLTLKNIGHFEDTNISFDDNITCLIGENGTGKTTLLRALGLGIIGTKNKRINLASVEKMLRTEGWINHKLGFYNEGSIELDYTIDNIKNTQKVVFKNNGFIDIENSGDFDILLPTIDPKINPVDLKTLVIGFPQIRDTTGNNSNSGSNQRRAHPNIMDLIPLVNNVDNECLESFSYWVVNLHVSGQNKLNEGFKKEEIEEWILIAEIFKIISKLTKHETIARKGIKLKNSDFSNPEDKERLEEDINRLEESAAYLNEVEEYKKVLREREEELESVLKELNDKLESLK